MANIPGVDASIITTPPLPSIGPDGPDPYFVVGVFERGDVTAPVEISGPSELATQFGLNQSYTPAWLDLIAYFRTGGKRATVQRIVGTTPVTATVVLTASSVRADAKSPGAFANGWKVEVAAGTFASTLKVTLFDALGTVIEGPYDNIAATSDAMAATTMANIVLVKTGASVPVATVAGGVALAGGTDDKATIVGANYVAALDKFTADMGPGFVSIPGIASTTAAGASTIGHGLIAHCGATGRTCALQPAVDAVEATALTMADTYRAAVNAQVATVVWPDVVVSDGGVVRHLGGNGFLAGRRARTARETGGFAQAPAGLLYGALDGAPIQGFTYNVTPERLTVLNAHGITVLKKVGSVPCVYGARSLASGQSPRSPYEKLRTSSMVYQITADVKAIGQRYVLRSIDDQMLSEFERDVVGYMERLRLKRQFASIRVGSVSDKGYMVDVRGANTPTTAANDELVCALSIRPPGMAEHVQFYVTVTPTNVQFA